MAKGVKTGGGPRTGIPNKATAEVQELARSYAPAVLKELARLATTAESEQARVAAGNIILDRAYGKARQPVDHGWDLTKLTDEQLGILAQATGAIPATSEPNPRRDRTAQTAH